MPPSSSQVQETLFYLAFALSGWYVPSLVIWPLVGGVNIRPIPYQVTKAGDVILDLTLNQELVEDVTIPGSLLIFTCIWIPLFLITLLQILTQTPTQNPTQTSPHTKPKRLRSLAPIHCFFYAIGIEQFTTQILKLYVGRLRPNFYALCGFDPTTLECTADMAHQYEARQSFPSGHSSLAFCGMGVLMWVCVGWWSQSCARRYSSGTTSSSKEDGKSSLEKAFRYKHWCKGVLVCLTPLLYATFVATSRIVDNWHHPSDILAGTIIGFSCATISYHLWFFPIFSNHAGVPIRRFPIKMEPTSEEESAPLTIPKV